MSVLSLSVLALQTGLSQLKQEALPAKLELFLIHECTIHFEVRLYVIYKAEDIAEVSGSQRIESKKMPILISYVAIPSGSPNSPHH